MSKISKLYIKNIRCFSGEISASLPRITVLVGENSTGKTTFLSCVSALSKLACNDKDSSHSQNPFNIEQFEMGNFENIARFKCKVFEIGGCVDGIKFNFKFGNDHRGLIEQVVYLEPESIEQLTIKRLQNRQKWQLTGPSFIHELNAHDLSYLQISEWLGKAIRYQLLPYSGDINNFKKRTNSSDSEVVSFTRLINYLVKLSSLLPSSDSVNRQLSPELNLPQRFYNSPRLYEVTDNIDKVEKLRKRLSEMGNQLELFSEILFTSSQIGGESLELVIDRKNFNLVDVGFGVHAILNLLTVVGDETNETVLIQQPETHLHPKAQALLSQLIATTTKSFVIETHSDHIINRLSICVRRGVLPPNEVGIIWFENLQGKVVLHEISFDQQGNVLNAPNNYREFFRRETESYLGFDS